MYKKQNPLCLMAILMATLSINLYSTGIRAEQACSQDMASSVQSFLKSLNETQRKLAVIAFNDTERTRWHFFPTEMHERKGVEYGKLTQAQKEACHAVLKTGFSEIGLTKIEQVRRLEGVLTELGQAGRFNRDPELYFMTIFGTPENAVWGWRFEGHHLAINITIKEGHVFSTTPTFFGSNPGTVPKGKHKGLQVLADEEKVARKLAQSLSKAQQEKAVIAHKAPKDILTRANRIANRLNPLGMPVSELTDEQMALFKELTASYIHNYDPAISRSIDKAFYGAGLDKIHFAWAGSMKPNEGHYYRIQTPDFLIEYDNVQKKATHAHTVFRSYKNDFGDLDKQ